MDFYNIEYDDSGFTNASVRENTLICIHSKDGSSFQKCMLSAKEVKAMYDAGAVFTMCDEFLFNRSHVGSNPVTITGMTVMTPEV